MVSCGFPDLAQLFKYCIIPAVLYKTDIDDSVDFAYAATNRVARFKSLGCRCRISVRKTDDNADRHRLRSFFVSGVCRFLCLLRKISHCLIRVCRWNTDAGCLILYGFITKFPDFFYRRICPEECVVNAPHNSFHIYCHIMILSPRYPSSSSVLP